MSAATIKQKTKSIDFEKEYARIIKKSTEFNRLLAIPPPSYFNVNENFKKFSLYTDCPNSITSFDTNASL